MRFPALILTALLLSACGQTGLAPVAAPAAQELSAQSDASLQAKAKSLYLKVFKAYDKDKDGKWTPADFALPEDRFLNLFHKEDSNDDKVVTAAEFLPADRLTDIVENARARAIVSCSSEGGHVGIDKAYDFLDVYLQPYLNQHDRKVFIQKAFNSSDANKDKVLNRDEAAVAIVVLEAQAEQKDIERKVNRSKGQDDKPGK